MLEWEKKKNLELYKIILELKILKIFKKLFIYSCLSVAIFVGPIFVQDNITHANEDVDVESLVKEVEELREIVDEIVKLLEDLNLETSTNTETDDSSDNNGIDEEESVERETSDTDGDGSRNNPYSIDDIPEFEVITTDDDWEDLFGRGTIEFVEFIRGDSAVDFMTSNYYSAPDNAPDGLEWAIISFNYKWIDSEDDESTYLSTSDFDIFTLDGSRINESGIYGHFENSFSIEEIYAGGSVSGKFSVLIPEDEEFLVRFGDDYSIDYIFFSFDQEK